VGLTTSAGAFGAKVKGAGETPALRKPAAREDGARRLNIAKHVCRAQRAAPLRENDAGGGCLVEARDYEEEASSIQGSAYDLGEAAPRVGGVLRSINVAGVEAKAQAGEMDGAQRAWSGLNVLEAKRALKRVEVKASAIELDERESGFGEKNGSYVFHGDKAVDGLRRRIRSRRRPIDVAGGICGGAVLQRRSGE
jgi:hypothetical protein